MSEWLIAVIVVACAIASPVILVALILSVLLVMFLCSVAYEALTDALYRRNRIR